MDDQDPDFDGWAEQQRFDSIHPEPEPKTPYEQMIIERTVELELKVAAPSVADLLAMQALSWRIRASLDESVGQTIITSGGVNTMIETIGVQLDILDTFLANQGVRGIREANQ